jgi:DNA-3-methyladenine glycosylase II
MSKKPFTSPEIAVALSASDPIMAALIQRHGVCVLETAAGESPYEALAGAIVFQQLNGKAAGTILQRVKDLAGGKRFPKPKEIAGLAEDGRLRAAGISGNKQRALLDLAEKAMDGSLPTKKAILEMPDAEIIERCTRVRGIGVWTVQMLLIFRLGRPDVLPKDDFGVRKGFQLAYGLEAMPTPKELDAHGAAWAPWRSVAAWYLWRTADAAK